MKIIEDKELKNITGGTCKPIQGALYGLAGGLVGALGANSFSVGVGVLSGLATCEWKHMDKVY